jgi:hypothetical protein
VLKVGGKADGGAARVENRPPQPLQERALHLGGLAGGDLRQRAQIPDGLLPAGVVVVGLDNAVRALEV